MATTIDTGGISERTDTDYTQHQAKHSHLNQINEVSLTDKHSDVEEDPMRLDTVDSESDNMTELAPSEEEQEEEELVESRSPIKFQNLNGNVRNIVYSSRSGPLRPHANPLKRKSPPSTNSDDLQPRLKIRLGGSSPIKQEAGPSLISTPPKPDESTGARTRSRSPIKPQIGSMPMGSIPDPPPIGPRRTPKDKGKVKATSDTPLSRESSAAPESKEDTVAPTSLAARRAPRRKVLKKGQVDESDPVAVAARDERRRKIDLALQDLEMQEKMINDGIHPLLMKDLYELDRRKARLIKGVNERETAAFEELEYSAECEDHQTRMTWNQIATDLANKIEDESWKKMEILQREAGYTHRTPGRHPVLRTENGQGGWAVYIDRLHHTKTVGLVPVYVPGSNTKRYRRDHSTTPRMLEPQEKLDDCIEFGLRAPRPLLPWKPSQARHPYEYGNGLYPPAPAFTFPTTWDPEAFKADDTQAVQRSKQASSSAVKAKAEDKPAVEGRQKELQEAEAAAREKAQKEAKAQEAAKVNAAAEKAERERLERIKASEAQHREELARKALREQEEKHKKILEEEAARAREAKAAKEREQQRKQQERQEQQRLDRERNEQAKLEKARLEKEKAAQEQLARQKEAQEKANREREARERLARELAAQKKAAEAKAAQEKEAREKAALEKAKQDKIRADELAAAERKRLELRAAAEKPPTPLPTSSTSNFYKPISPSPLHGNNPTPNPASRPVSTGTPSATPTDANGTAKTPKPADSSNTTDTPKLANGTTPSVLLDPAPTPEDTARFFKPMRALWPSTSGTSTHRIASAEPKPMRPLRQYFAYDNKLIWSYSEIEHKHMSDAEHSIESLPYASRSPVSQKRRWLTFETWDGTQVWHDVDTVATLYLRAYHLIEKDLKAKMSVMEYAEERSRRREARKRLPDLPVVGGSLRPKFKHDFDRDGGNVPRAEWATYHPPTDILDRRGSITIGSGPGHGPPAGGFGAPSRPSSLWSSSQTTPGPASASTDKSSFGSTASLAQNGSAGFTSFAKAPTTAFTPPSASAASAFTKALESPTKTEVQVLMPPKLGPALPSGASLTRQERVSGKPFRFTVERPLEYAKVNVYKTMEKTFHMEEAESSELPPTDPDCEYMPAFDRYRWRAGLEWGMTYLKSDAIYEVSKRWDMAQGDYLEILEMHERKEKADKAKAVMDEEDRLEMIEWQKTRLAENMNDTDWIKYQAKMKAARDRRRAAEAEEKEKQKIEKEKEQRRKLVEAQQERHRVQMEVERMKRERADRRNAQARERRRLKKLADAKAAEGGDGGVGKDAEGKDSDGKDHGDAASLGQDGPA